MIKGLIKEGRRVVNRGAGKRELRQYTRQMLTAMKGEIDSNTVIVRNFNTPLTSMNRLSRQKINKETQALNDTLDKRD